MLTLSELIERMLTQWETHDIIDILEITTEDLMDHFENRVAERYEEIAKELEE